MGFSISQITNTKKQAVPVKNLGLKQIMQSNKGTLAISSEIVVLDTTKGITIDKIIWSVNKERLVRIRLMPYIDGVATVLSDVKYDGSGVQGLYPDSMMLHGSAFFDFLEYDTTNNRYKFKLKQPLVFSEGVKITMSNTSTIDEANYAVVVLGREYD